MTTTYKECTFFARFGGALGEFGRAVVRILARPIEADVPPKRAKNKIRYMGY